MFTMAAMPSGFCHLKIGLCLNIEEEDQNSYEDAEFIPQINHFHGDRRRKVNSLQKIEPRPNPDSVETNVIF